MGRHWWSADSLSLQIDTHFDAVGDLDEGSPTHLNH
jgi:hypothetical protein